MRSTIFGWGHGADLHGCVDYRVCSTTSISRLSHGIVEISSLHFGDMLEAQRLPRGHAVHEISFKSADPVIMVTPLVGRVLLAFSSDLVINHMVGCLQSIMLRSPFIFMFHLLIPYPAFSIALIELPNTTALVNHPVVPSYARSDIHHSLY